MRRSATTRRTVLFAAAILACVAGSFATAAGARTLKVAGIYTVPVQQKWVATLHRALNAAQQAGEIDYSFTEKVQAADYANALRRVAGSGVDLIVGEAFDIGAEARRIADAHPNVAFLMGDSGAPHGSNFAVFDNWIHEPCYLMGVIAGAMSKSGRIGMVGGKPIGEVNRLFHAFIDGARSVNPGVRFKVAFTGSWYDPDAAKRLATDQIDAGVDVLFAEREGVAEAARARGVLAFGNVNDMHRHGNGTGVVVASALWHMEPAINRAIALIKQGRFAAADYRDWSMMRRGGASLSPFYEFESRIPAAAKEKVRALTSQIKSGAFTVRVDDSRPKSTF
jgi:basic membrane lipoprotein Med (substrate-binding protein (PBP1-ABC) superfamily)